MPAPFVENAFFPMDGFSSLVKVSDHRCVSSLLGLQFSDWERIFFNPKSDRKIISNIYKELKKLDHRNSSNPIKKCGTELNIEFPSEVFYPLFPL